MVVIHVDLSPFFQYNVNRFSAAAAFHGTKKAAMLRQDSVHTKPDKENRKHEGLIIWK